MESILDMTDLEDKARDYYVRMTEGWNVLDWESLLEDTKSLYKQRVRSLDLIIRLRKRAEIRRSIPRGEPDRIADLLEEAANALEGKND